MVSHGAEHRGTWKSGGKGVMEIPVMAGRSFMGHISGDQDNVRLSLLQGLQALAQEFFHKQALFPQQCGYLAVFVWVMVDIA